ncbi:tetratricopeptide repeat protein [Veronia pacifica]|uniref:Tetratricopeptide repeat protein 38 n=1 Tax=Veronia pacifica TaxID=1080227 RepID=A0A1C3EMD4_9GAMM|nr:tetratricopeptide repeat protein [Veronia pacifica]ODA34398.1 hypothetical protein A8L45_06660 [Veronia pacifica]
MVTDVRGLALTGTDYSGAQKYQDVIQKLYDYRPNLGSYLQPLIDEYPEFIMARVVLAYGMASEGRYSSLVNVAIKGSELNSLREGATERESLHIDAVNTWSKGDLKGAIEIWDAILAKWPFDLVAFRQMTMNLFWMGQRRRLADLCARLMPYWDETTPDYGFFIGPVGFVMEELGQYSLAEKYARRAVELNPSDMWAVHAVAHVLEMQGRNEEGIDWIEPKSHVFHEHNAFVGHLWWHLSLFHLESGNVDKVLSLFDQQVYPGNSDFYLDIQNGASLLSRLSFIGVDVGDRWKKLLEAVENAKLDYVYDFTDIHNAIVLARNERFGELKSMNDQLSRRLSSSDHDPWLTYQLTKAIEDIHMGDPARAADRLAPIRYDQLALGGSHAQQDLFLQYQIMAYRNSENLPMMKAALKERLAKRIIGNDVDGYLTKARQIDSLTLNDSITPYLQKVSG